ncbi:hypothetical protein POM88_041678 [Heracleum sosnowskyi]|uniref:Uncharacterized protein n=1 Tax=Heracleum sosnowskyi TaxID=360622 RepID=A0AAD8HH91_9APIA|nr:hypothetical protein POM88_041678 [Heracleum sosnowskyi]
MMMRATKRLRRKRAKKRFRRKKGKEKISPKKVCQAETSNVHKQATTESDKQQKIVTENKSRQPDESRQEDKDVTNEEQEADEDGKQQPEQQQGEDGPYDSETSERESENLKKNKVKMECQTGNLQSPSVPTANTKDIMLDLATLSFGDYVKKLDQQTKKRENEAEDEAAFKEKLTKIQKSQRDTCFQKSAARSPLKNSKPFNHGGILRPFKAPAQAGPSGVEFFERNGEQFTTLK